MMTNKPVNANDEDLKDGMIGVGQPIDQPTSMSYCLQRIRLGEFCREITDSAPFDAPNPGTPDYEKTKHIDGKIREFAAGLPPFFSLSYDLDQLPKSNGPRSTGLIVQRYILNNMLNTQRCRLHLPYLSLAFKDPKYEYSRKACLDAARIVIRAPRQLSQEVIPFAQAPMKVSGMLHCVCVAIIVLLIDYCGGSDQQEKEGGRAEIFDAFAILEEAKEQSPFAGRLLESFHTVLRRHNASTSAVGGSQSIRLSGQHTASPGLTSQSKAPTAMELTTNDDFVMDPTLPILDDLWQVFDESVDSSAVDWSGFFAELDSPFRSMY
ncbi:uncharacterized protein N7529_005845 [Penicillium soppii]|uniref:uncharacterized protein n=1 Tax=Penicillium soppii TaxID=69789 RepID=UPI0025479CB5|nr:uncharacterized protein N7529_005845 [Penicillium soppii]KAJ5863929.1 hypothetical protein N7529_005845 [Penicillium soppii]